MSHALRTSLFFADTAPTEIYTLSLHDALPISAARVVGGALGGRDSARVSLHDQGEPVPHAHQAPDGHARYYERLGDRKSTRLNSSHPSISYAVFCLKKKTYH